MSSESNKVEKPDKNSLIGKQKDAYEKLENFIESGERMFCLEGFAGCGKAQPLHSKICTPKGWVSMGEINIGDEVFTKNGTITKVTGVYPQGKKEIIEIEFSDGELVECCKEHLWYYSTKGGRRKSSSGLSKKKNCKVNSLTLSEIEAGVDWVVGDYTEFKSQIKDIWGRSNLTIPTPKPIEFDKADLKIDPYIVGEFLRGATSIEDYGSFSNHFQLEGFDDGRGIPEQYKTSSIADRLGLIRGLLNTSRKVSNKGTVFYSSPNKKLCEDLKEVVLSLGGSCYPLRSKKTKKGINYTTSFRLNYGMDLFSHGSKLDKWRHTNSKPKPKYIKNVRELPVRVVCQCISVECPTQSYITDGFTVTHNTYITNMFVQDMIHKYSSRICVAAPTHKAVSVIRRMAEFKSDNLDYSTIHSLLGLRPYITNHGKEAFTKDSQNKNRVGEFDILIIDESSQLDDQLFVYLMEELDGNPDLKIIFVGDGKQLPPVNHVSSIPMDREKREKYKIQYAALTEIVRQQNGNPLIDISKEFRKFIYQPRTLINKETKDGVVVVDRKNRKRVLELLFTSGEYEQNGDFCRATAWTNDTVNWYNKEIRKMVYKNRIKNRIKELKESEVSEEEMIKLLKEEFPYWNKGKMKLPKYLIGDKVIVDKPIFDSETQQIIYQTNEELIIEDYTIENRIGKDKMYKCYIADVKNIFTGKKEIIELIHDDDELKFERHQDKLREYAVRQKVGTKTARDAWVQYYDLDKRFARLKYAPCLTTYKSQGSTYDNIIVICDDIIRNPKRREVFQHLYVGITRARKKAFLFI